MKALARLHLSALGLALTFAATPAYAQSQGMLDNVLNRYKGMAAAWASVFTTHATILFGALAAISLIWTFGQMALRRADLGEFASETIRFAVFCGVFWWLLINGPAIGIAIIEGLRSLGAQASGLPNNLAPSGIVDIGFDIFRQTNEEFSITSPFQSTIQVLIALGVLIVLALVGVNMLLLLASGYILAYGGVIFLGFGGSRWTSDIALNYFKTVVAVGASLMTMVLIVGVGKTFLDQYYAQTGAGATVQDLGTMVGGVISGGSIHAAGGIGAFGAGAALGAAGMAAGAAATGGAMIAAGAMNAAGGASAIKAAFAAAGGSGGEGGQTGMGGGSEAASAGGGTATSAAAGSEAADREDGNGGGAAGGSPAGEGEASSASSQGEGTPESGDTGGTQRTGLSRAAKTASILGGAAAGMAVGALKERVGNTVGGRLAANIRASAASASSGSETLAPATGAGSPASSSDSSPPPTAQFAGDTISAARDAGDMETPEDEVAAFVQRRGDS